MVSLHYISFGLEGKRQPYDLLAARVNILLSKVNFLVWASQHQKVKHFLSWEKFFGVPFLVIIHGDDKQTVNKLENNDDSLAPNPVTFE